MQSRERFFKNRLKPQQGKKPDMNEMHAAATDAQKMFALSITLYCQPDNKKARASVDELLQKTGTNLSDWQQPYEQRRALESKGGVTNYV